MNRKTGIWFLWLTAVALLVVGCGGTGNETDATESGAKQSDREAHSGREWRVTLEGSESAQDLGILTASGGGFFEDLGRKVWVGSPIEPNRPVFYVTDGIDDFGVTQMPQLIEAKDNGAPIVAIGSLVSESTAALIWLQGSRINGIADLKGKTIATAGVPFQKDFLEAALARAGLTLAEVTVMDAGDELGPALLSGRADAIFGGSGNIEGVEVESHGKTPVVTKVQDLGVPDYEELVVITRSKLVAEDPQLIRDFMASVARGTNKAIEDPEGAVRVIRTALESSPPPNWKMIEAQVKMTIPLLSPSGYMSPQRSRNLVDWMYEQQMIQRKLSPDELLTNEYR